MRPLSKKLIPFEKGPLVQGFTLNVDVARSEDTLNLQYLLKGPVDTLVIPLLDHSNAKKVGLFKHLCFEVFLWEPSGAYTEWNFSPSGEWSIYLFESYRMPDSKRSITAAIEKHTFAAAALEASLKVSVSIPIRTTVTAVGLSTVLEHQNGSLSYWALKHCKEKPDFHTKDSFEKFK